MIQSRQLMLLAALLVAAQRAESGPMNVSTKDGVTEIADVAPLDWMGDGQTTFCGALDRAANAMGIKSDYPTLMGDSALAFRVRWWRKDGGPGWCPSSPVGEFNPWSDRAAASLGLKIKFEVQLHEKQPDMGQYAEQVKKSIDEGRPVLVYAEALDMGVIYGYADDGDTIVVRDYYKGKKPFTLPLEKSKGLLGFIEKTGDRPAERERAALALKNAVADWHAAAEKWNSRPGPGKYLLGDAAYAQWIDDLKSAGKLPEDDRKQLFQPSWWTFCVLVDARLSAQKYLTQIAPLFEGETRAALERAAASYGESARAGGAVFGAKDCFFGPWSGKSIADWNDDARAKEAELLTTMRDTDNKAMAEIEKVVMGLK